MNDLINEYMEFVNKLGVQRSKIDGCENDPHTDEMSFVLLHMSMGMVTEAAEIMDILKKHMAYGRVINKTKLYDELSDLYFYFIGAVIELGLTPNDIIKINMAKLNKRYPNGYNHDSANNRNISAEDEAIKMVVNVDGNAVIKGSIDDDRTWKNEPIVS